MTPSFRHAFRDFFRRRRVARHVAAHGDRYDYHGIAVEVPAAAGLGVRNALLRGKYERDEAAMIGKYLPADLPVIELGGSLGVVSAFVRSRIGRAQRHVIVEANADLIGICRSNAARQADPGAVDVVNAALYYGGPVARLSVSRDVHSSALGAGGVEVPAVTLGALAARLARPYALVSDIEGGEYPIASRDAAALADARVAIMEIHPDAYRAMGGSEAAFLDAWRELGFSLVDRQADVVVLVRAPSDSR